MKNGRRPPPRDGEVLRAIHFIGHRRSGLVFHVREHRCLVPLRCVPRPGWRRRRAHKTLRFCAQTAEFESGRVPLARSAPWLDVYIRELTAWQEHRRPTVARSAAAVDSNVSVGNWGQGRQRAHLAPSQHCLLLGVANTPFDCRGSKITEHKSQGSIF
jgi:hypothetical protein